MKYQKPKGTRDLFGRDLQRVEAVCQAARVFFGQNGYAEIRTPTFEFAQLFDRSIGERTDIVEHEMYKFEVNEKLYALRPEGTASVLRAVIENKLPLPARFLYIWPMYRRERPQKGRYREFLQIGIEILGEGNPFYDAEIIDQGKRFLDLLGAKGCTIEINSIGCPKCRVEYKKKLRAYLEPEVNNLCANCRRRFEKNFLRIFDCKNETCQHIYTEAPKITDNLCSECLEHYTSVKKFLKTFGIEYSENKSLVRGLDYYTRTVVEFKQQTLGAQDTILAGGRYDLLMKELGGNDAPCTGWAMGVDRLLIGMPDELPEIKEKKKFYIATIGGRFIKDTIGLRDLIQRNNFVCMMGDPEVTIKQQLKAANRARVDYSLIYGEDEAQENSCTIKDMKTGEQNKIPIDHVASFLGKLVNN
jgi:histidyl-tRNA synthetase